jgi:hypothetical protein
VQLLGLAARQRSASEQMPRRRPAARFRSVREVAVDGTGCYPMLHMWAVTVVSRNGVRPASLRGARSLCLLLGALGGACGADARDVAQSSGALEPAPATEVAGDTPDAAREDTPAPGTLVPAAAGPVAEHSSPVITEPPEPAPLPSAELNTTRPVDSTEPVDVVVPPGDCRFEYLGEWVRCENAGWPNVLETDAPDLLSCMQLCLERDDCTAVTDHRWLGLEGLGCSLYLSTCDEPAFAVWGEESGGHEFRRVCD